MFTHVALGSLLHDFVDDSRVPDRFFVLFVNYICHSEVSITVIIIIMKSTKVQPLGRIWGNIGIFGLKTPLRAYVL